MNAGRLFCLVALTVDARALNPAYSISHYSRTSWTADAGIQAVRRIKQSPDGYLWLATRVGLVRFDGVRFTTFKAGAEKGLESSTTQDILIDPDGSMWVATLGGGVAHYQAGKFRTYTVRDGLPSDEIGCLYRDSRGTLWVGTRGAGIARMVGDHFEKLPLAIGLSRITAFLEGPDHALWIATVGYGVFRLQNGILASFTVDDGIPDNRVAGLYVSHSGRIWTTGFKGISFWNGTRFVADSAVNAAVGESEAISCIEDRDGNLWVASSSGLFRARGNEVSRMDRSTGLSSDFVSDIFEDREGNLWAGTRGGLDRLQDGQVRIFKRPEGASPNHAPLVADNRGLWTVSNDKVTRISANTIRNWPLSVADGATPVTLLSKSNAGLWIGFSNGVTSWAHDHTQLLSELAGLDVRSLLGARDGSIWIGTSNRGLLRWVPSAGSRGLTETGVTDRFISTLAEDRTGAIWAGSGSGGGLYRLSDGNVQHFGQNEGLRSPQVYTLLVDRKGQLWIGSTGGLSWFEDGRIRTVNSRQGLPADQVLELLDDSYDRLWFIGFAGISALNKKSLADWAARRIDKLNPILYPSVKGLQVFTAGVAFPNAAHTPDGHLWFSIADGLVEVTPPDPSASHISQFPVLVEDVTVDGVPHREPGPIRMPPGTRSVELRYTALALSRAEGVRFRYRLEGIDNDWVNADTRRLASYNNLKPGIYRFRVEASTGEEQWQQSSALVLEQLPFFYQTWWFIALASSAILSLAFIIYRLRVRQVEREFNVRLEERIGERTRIARDLHDTLLQSFQGLLFEFQAARNLFARHPEDAIRTMDDAIGSAEAAIAEGRDAIQDLRSGLGAGSDLVQLLTATGKELSQARGPKGGAIFALTVEGQPKTLMVMVQDEIYRIGRELLLNAFKHARARRIEVEVRYDEQMLRVRIRDDGIGIDPRMLGGGARPGHWGLPGVRERAKLVGAKLDFWSEAGAGTEVQIAIPGVIAYGHLRNRHTPGLFPNTTISNAD
jgi:ligand-binding sensor domain-containing protein/signal transduction histidine kinase